MKKIISEVIIGGILDTGFTTYAIEKNISYQEQAIKYLEETESALFAPKSISRVTKSIAYSNLEILKEFTPAIPTI